MADEDVANETETEAHELPNEESGAATPDDTGKAASADDAGAESEDGHAAADETSEFPGDEFSDFPDDDLEDIEDGDRPRGSKRRLMIYGGAGVAGVVVLAAAAFFLFFGSDDGAGGEAPAVAEMPADDGSPVPRVTMALPSRERAPMSSAAPEHRGMSPPTPAESAAAPPHGAPPAPDASPETPSPDGEPRMLAGPAGAAAPVGSLNAVAASVTAPGAGVVVPAVTTASYANVPVRPPAAPLPPAPDPALIVDSPKGPLPRVARDGRQPWHAYARPFQETTDGMHKVAIVISGLGLSEAATEAAIERLPPEVTLAFSPYAKALQTWVITAREGGHEILLGVPMEPTDFPKSDPGPYTLETEAEGAENVERLQAMMSRAAGYVGLIDIMGSGFSESEAALKPVLAEVRQRGLLYIDSGAAQNSKAGDVSKLVGIPFAAAIARLEAGASRAVIDQRLADLEAAARRQSGAIVIAEAHPATIERIALWASGLGSKSLRLAPVSAVVATRNVPSKKAVEAAPAPAPAAQH